MNSTSVRNPKKMYRFSIEYPKLNFRLQASSQIDMEEWIEKINEIVSKSVGGDDNYEKMQKAMKKKSE